MFRKDLLQRVHSDGYLKLLRKLGEETTESKQQVDILLKILCCEGMPDLHSHVLPMQSCPINLRDRTRSYWLSLEVLKDLVNGLSVHSFYRLFRTFQLMHRRTFPQHYELFGHVFADYISTVTQVLKSFDPHKSCPFYAPKKDIEPVVLRPLPET